MRTALAHLSRARRSEDGSAVMVMLALLVLIMMLCVATTQSVVWSRHEIKLIDQRQIARLAATATNAPTTPAKPVNTQ